MTGSGDFSVTTAGAVVVGGIAALLLATVIALGGYGRPGDRPAQVPTSPAAGGALPEAEVEYWLDMSEQPATPKRRTP